MLAMRPLLITIVQHQSEMVAVLDAVIVVALSSSCLTHRRWPTLGIRLKDILRAPCNWLTEDERLRWWADERTAGTFRKAPADQQQFHPKSNNRQTFTTHRTFTFLQKVQFHLFCFCSHSVHIQTLADLFTTFFSFNRLLTFFCDLQSWQNIEKVFVIVGTKVTETDPNCQG